MISPSASPADCPYLAWACPRVHNEPVPGFVPGTPHHDVGSASLWRKDPGSAFGPKTVPLATGLVAVVYWMPAPFPGPTPRSGRPARCRTDQNLPPIGAMSTVGPDTKLLSDTL